MQPTGPEPGPATMPINDEPREPAGAPSGGGDFSSGLERSALLLVLAVGLGVGVTSWLVGELAEGAFQPRRLTATIRNGVQTELITDSAKSAADIKNVTLSTGLFGALLGSALGLAGGLARRSTIAARRAALVGLGAGAVAGGAAALAIVTLYYRRFPRFFPEGLAEPMLMHAATWGAIGAAGGLAFGLGLGGRGRWAKSLVGGLVGAMLGAAIYEVVGALAFPTSRTFQPSAADWAPRLLGRLLVASLAAIGAALAISDQARTKPAA